MLHPVNGQARGAALSETTRVKIQTREWVSFMGIDHIQREGIGMGLRMIIRRVFSGFVVRPVWLLTFGLGLLFSMSDLMAAEIAFDRRLPSDTVLYARVHNVQQFLTQMQKTTLGKIALDPAMEEFRKELNDKLAEQLAEKIKQNVGVGWKDLLQVLQGETAVALCPVPGQDMQLVLSVQFGEHQETLQTLLTKLSETLEASGRNREEDEIDGTKVIVFKPEKKDEEKKSEDEDDDKPEVKSPLGWFLKDQTLVMATGMESLRAVHSRWDGEAGESLSENRSYTVVQETCRGNEDSVPQILFYFDPVGILKAALAASDTVAPEMTLMVGFLPQLGLDRFRAVGFTIDYTEEQPDGVTRMLIEFDQPPKGVLRMLTLMESKHDIPRWVPAKVDSYFSVHWDLQEAYAAVEETYDKFNGAGQFGTLMDRIGELSPPEKFHPKKDFLDLLTGRIQIVTQGNEVEKTGTDQILVAVELKDAPGMTRTLARLAKLPAFPGKSRKFDGATIYSLKDDTAEEKSEDEESEQNLYWTVAGQQLLFGNSATQVENVLRNADAKEPLAELPSFRQYLASQPDQIGAVMTETQNSQLKTFYNLLRELGNFDVGTILEQESLSIDFGTLPAYEAIEKYLSPTVGFMRKHEHGIYFESRYLKSEE